MVLGMEPRTSNMLGKLSPTKLHLQSLQNTLLKTRLSIPSSFRLVTAS